MGSQARQRIYPSCQNGFLMPPQFLITIPPGASSWGQSLLLSPEESHHVREVFRLKEGDILNVFDGRGNRYSARLGKTEGPRVSILLLEKLPEPEARSVICLGQSLLKGEKMEWVLQKSVELGVHSFQPFYSSRTIVKGTVSGNKDTRWKRIIESSSKQCGRSSLMEIAPAVSFHDLVIGSKAPLKIVFWEEETKNLRDFFGEIHLSPHPPLTLVLIGPEGGFSKEEIQEAKDHGFVSLSLGPRILRVDTAAVMALSLVQYELERK